MSAPAVANILHGSAVVWVAPTGESWPDETSVDLGDDWAGNWERVGYTKSPLVMAYAAEELEIGVEEVLGSVKRVKIGESLTLETTLAEIAAEYLQLATQGTVATTAAGASQRGFEQLPIGGVDLEEKAWGFEGTYTDSSGDSFPVRVFLDYATGTLNGSLEFSKADFPGIPLIVKALADTANADRLAVFQRVTAEATS